MTPLRLENQIEMMFSSVSQSELSVDRAVQYVDQLLSTLKQVGFSEQEKNHTMYSLCD